MPTQMTQEQIDAQQRRAIEPKSPIYRKLLHEKFAAQTDREKVLTSIIVAMAEDIDKIKRAIKFLSDQDIEISAGLNACTEALFGDTVAANGVNGAVHGSPVVDPKGMPEELRDKTPFPTDVQPTVVTGSAGPLPGDIDSGEPDVKSGPATNAAPIPKAGKPKGPTPNATPATPVGNGDKGVRP